MSVTRESDVLSSSIQHNSSDNLNIKMLMMIEAQMPLKLVEEFIDIYESKKNPLSEILLYNIWKNFKDLVVLDLLKDQAIIETTNENSLENSTISLLDHYEDQFGKFNIINLFIKFA